MCWQKGHTNLNREKPLVFFTKVLLIIQLKENYGLCCSKEKLWTKRGNHVANSFIKFLLIIQIFHQCLSVSQTKFILNTWFNILYNNDIYLLSVAKILVLLSFIDSYWKNWYICHIWYYWNIYIGMYYCAYGYNFNLLIIFGFPIPIIHGFHIDEICSYEYKLKCFKDLSTYGGVFLKCHID